MTISVSWFEKPGAYKAEGNFYGYNQAIRKTKEACLKLGMQISAKSHINVDYCAPHAYEYFPGKYNVLYCLDPRTRILTSDLRWIANGNISVGDELIGFDEEISSKQKLRRSQVVDVQYVRAPACRIIFDDGTEVVAGLDHRWIVRRDYGPHPLRTNRLWVRTLDLIPGDLLSRWTQVWSESEAYDVGWFSGLVDGEGSVSNPPNIARGIERAGGSFCMAQKPGLVLDRAHAVLEKYGFSYHDTLNQKTGVVNMRIHNPIRALGFFRPIRLLPRANLVWEGRRTWSNKTSGARVVRVESIGEKWLVGMKTNTSTFLAEGFFSHNSMYETPDIVPSAMARVQKADLVVVPSKWCQSFFRKWTNKPVEVVPLGINHIPFTQRKAPSGEGQKFRFLWLGAFNARKGWYSLAAVWDGIFSKVPFCELYIKTTTSNEQLKRTIHKGNTIIDGRTISDQEMIDLYHSAHCFVMPTMGEGFGLTVAEAMSSGCPTITTEYSGMLEYATRRNCFFLPCKVERMTASMGGPSSAEDQLYQFAVVDLPQLGTIMARVMHDYDNSLIVGKRAHKDMQAYTWERTGRELMAILRNL